jgi:uncharacterized membrane protein YjgN (DUF898 family)
MIMIIDLGIIYNSGSIFNTGCNRDKRNDHSDMFENNDNTSDQMIMMIMIMTMVLIVLLIMLIVVIATMFLAIARQ